LLSSSHDRQLPTVALGFEAADDRERASSMIRNSLTFRSSIGVASNVVKVAAGRCGAGVLVTVLLPVTDGMLNSPFFLISDISGKNLLHLDSPLLGCHRVDFLWSQIAHAHRVSSTGAHLIEQSLLFRAAGDCYTVALALDELPLSGG
jgi:hypothetical protein